MAEDIKSPQFPESIFEGTLSNWLKKTGDAIKQDEVLAEIETDKVVIEVTAASDGVMGEIIVSEGETIESSQLIGNYTKGATTAKEKPKAEIKEEIKLSASTPKETTKPKKETAPKQVETKADAKMQDNKNFRMGPAAKKLLNEKNLEISSLKPSTKKGVVTKEDVIKASEPAKQKEDTAQTEILGSSKRVPMTRLRSVVAKRLLESQSQTASLTTFNEVDLFEVKKLREKYRDSFEEKFGVKLGFMGMFMKASSIALQEMPIVNASIDGDDIVYHGHQDIGVAVSSERGLVVPVVRNVSELSISEIEIAIRDYSIKAREGKLGMEDITGGTFTISNGGVFGSLLSTPILNPPQSAILGMHKIQDRPMVVDGKIEIRPMMYLALTYDHRLLVSFLVKIKESLEAPESMILGV